MYEHLDYCGSGLGRDLRSGNRACDWREPEVRTIAELRQMFEYDPETGVILRLSTGRPCGSPNGNGYLRVNINGWMVYAHRLAFMLRIGREPDLLDHRNNVRSDNRWCNLRECSKAENNKSKLKRSNARTSRFIGVSFETQTSRWKAQLTVDGKRVTIGRFDTEEQAARAYDAAVLKHNGEFAKPNHGTKTVSNDHPRLPAGARQVQCVRADGVGEND